MSIPPAIARLAEHLVSSGESEGIALLLAGNTVEKWAAAGTNHKGRKLSEATRARAREEIEAWRAELRDSPLAKHRATVGGATMKGSLRTTAGERAAHRQALAEGLLPSFNGSVLPLALQSAVVLLDGKNGSNDVDPVDVRERLAAEEALCRFLVEGLGYAPWPMRGEQGKFHGMHGRERASKDGTRGLKGDGAAKCESCGSLKPSKDAACPSCGKLLEAGEGSMVALARADVARHQGRKPGRTRGRAGQAKDPEFERLHPRAPAGRTGGGQWIQKGAGMGQKEGSPVVKSLQQRLSHLGYKVAPDGKFGPVTDQAVKRFQRDMGIDPSGKIDPETTATLRAPPRNLSGTIRTISDVRREEAAAQAAKAPKGRSRTGRRRAGSTAAPGSQYGPPDPDLVTGGDLGPFAVGGGGGLTGVAVTYDQSRPAAPTLRPVTGRATGGGGTRAPGTRAAPGGAAAGGGGSSVGVAGGAPVAGTRTGAAAGAPGAPGAPSGPRRTSTPGQGARGRSDQSLQPGDGMKNPSSDVQTAQSDLQDLGFDLGAGGTDGRYGPDTKAAVRQFQSQYGIPTTGVLDAMTRNLLKQVKGGSEKTMRVGSRTIKVPKDVLSMSQGAEMEEASAVNPSVPGSPSSMTKLPYGGINPFLVNNEIIVIPQPPNLREAEAWERCSNCVHFDGVNACRLYGDYAVDADDICNDHYSLTPEEGRHDRLTRKLAEVVAERDEALEAGDDVAAALAAMRVEVYLELQEVKSSAYPGLDRSPRENWVDKAGGLPKYIERIAKHLHYEKGKPIGQAIAIAVNAVKKMCASGDVNFPGKQNVNPGSRAQACAAVADWEKKKGSAKLKEAVALMESAEEVTYPTYAEAFALAEAATGGAMSENLYEAYDRLEEAVTQREAAAASGNAITFMVARAKETRLREATLTAAARKKLPKSAFVFPDKAPGSGSYPHHDRAHGANALARSKGKPEHATVKAAVCKRHPDLPECKKED